MRTRLLFSTLLCLAAGSVQAATIIPLYAEAVVVVETNRKPDKGLPTAFATDSIDGEYYAATATAFQNQTGFS